MRDSDPPATPPPSSSFGPLLAAAATFGLLVLVTPFVAYLFRVPLARGGLTGLLVLFALCAVLLVLSVGCLALFLRAHARATVPPDHTSLATRATPDEAALMLAFGFDPDDLQANRTGMLSARQRANLRVGRNAMVAMGTTMIGVTYLSLAFMPVALDASGTGVFSPDSAGLWIGVGIINALVGGSFLYTYRLVRDQVHQRLSVTEGPAGPPGHDGDGHPASRSIRTVRIGAVAVPVLNAEQVEAVRAGRAYRVSYIRAPIAIVLSIDPL